MSTMIILGLAVILTSSALIHPMHVSVMELEYDDDEKRIESSLHVFIDDIETHIKQLNRLDELDIMSLNTQERNRLLKPYFESHVRFEVNREKYGHTYLGHEAEGEAFYIYIEVSNVKKLKSLSVTNTTLLDLYSDQANLIHFEYADEIHTEKLDREEHSATYVLSEL